MAYSRTQLLWFGPPVQIEPIQLVYRTHDCSALEIESDDRRNMKKATVLMSESTWQVLTKILSFFSRIWLFCFFPKFRPSALHRSGHFGGTALRQLGATWRSPNEFKGVHGGRLQHPKGYDYRCESLLDAPRSTVVEKSGTLWSDSLPGRKRKPYSTGWLCAIFSRCVTSFYFS